MFSFFLFFFCNAAIAQYSVEEVKTGFIYKFSQSLKWKISDSDNTFDIAVMNSDTKMFDALTTALKGKYKDGLPIVVKKIKFSELDQLESKILYISKLYNKRIGDIVEYTEGRNILRITDNLKDEQLVMINFVQKNESLSFEVNTLFISAADIEISQDLLLLGGDEIDIINVYKQMQEQLSREMARVEAQSRKIEGQKQRLGEQFKAIGFQSDKIMQQRQTLLMQKKTLTQMQQKITESQQKLEEQDELLLRGQEALFLSKMREENIKKRTQEFRREILKAKVTLKELRNSISQNRRIIAKQILSLDKKEIILKKQKFYLYAVLVIVVLLAAVIYFVVRNYRLKNKAHKVLVSKNEEITAQKHKLEKQTNYLDIANKSLDAKNNLINAGIRYAKTIQSAVLPSLDTLSEYHRNFIIFKPKDIVSGDFFWIAAKNKLSKEFLFVAVVDCTGHGVPGAFMSFVGNRILNDIIVINSEVEPVTILDKLHERVMQLFVGQEVGHRDGMVISLVRIEKQPDNNFELMMAGAKQAMFIKPKDSDDLIRKKGSIKDIGSPHYDMLEFKQESRILPAGSLIYLLSDGIIDQNNSERKKLGTRGIKKILSEASKLDILDQKSFLSAEFEKFSKGEEQRDDITVVGIEL